MPIGSGGGSFNGGLVTGFLDVRDPGSIGVADSLGNYFFNAYAPQGVTMGDFGSGNRLTIDQNSVVTLNPNAFGVLNTGPHAAPADAALAAGYWVLWLDQTIGATKLMVKAKDSGGTVRTAAIALS